MAVFDPPAGLAWSEVEMQKADTIAAAASAYSGAESGLDFGGAWWTARATTALLDAGQAAAVSAWLARVRQVGNQARIAFPTPQAVRGTTAAATLTTTGSLAALGSSVAVSGLGSNRTLLAGVLVSIDDRLFEIVADAAADGAGAATLTLWPRARTAFPAGRTVKLGAAAAGLWRLAALPPTPWRSGLYTRMSLTLREAF